MDIFRKLKGYFESNNTAAIIAVEQEYKEKLQHTLESSAVKGVRPVSFGVNPPQEDELCRALLTECLENKLNHVFALSSASEGFRHFVIPK